MGFAHASFLQATGGKHTVIHKLAAILALLLAAPALAQVPPAELGQRNVPAPWWMREPVIASLGSVRAELPANRADFSVRFSAVERSAAEATTAASGKAAALDKALSALGTERVRLTTSFSTRPLYDQYRQKDGTLVDNQRADRIDAYEVTADLAVAVRDMAVLERAYRTVVAARPTAITPISFRLEPDNAMKTWAATEAVADAARRARLAVAATGGRLGAPKVIDPSGGVCQTQVLAGWPSYGGGTAPTDVSPPADMARYAASPAPAPPPAMAPSLAEAAESVQVTLQPPLRQITDTACVIYALLP